MGDGYIHWYRRRMNVEEVDEQLCRFHSLGIVVRNAASGLITALDGGGDQIAITYEALVNALVERDDVSFQLWLDDSSVDVYCRFRTLSGTLMVQTYGLNGKTRSERLRIQSALWNAFGRSLAASEALVADLNNRTEPFDWDAAVVGRRRRPDWPLADLLALRGDDFGAHRGQPGLGEFRVMYYDRS